MEELLSMLNILAEVEFKGIRVGLLYCLTGWSCGDPQDADSGSFIPIGIGQIFMRSDSLRILINF